MTKSDMALWLAEKRKMSVNDADAAVNIFFESMAEGLSEGKRIEIRGFGTFRVREYDGYMGRNPRTGESVAIAPKRLPFFKLAKKMQQTLNGDKNDV